MTGTIVRKEVTVRAPRDRAFRVFTDGIDRWWPREHHIGKSPMKQLVIESRIGGRWYALCEDNTQCDIGVVLAWEPPARAVFAWQITGDWQFDAKFHTEVHVTFTDLGDGRTRVVLEHRGLEAYGPAAKTVITSLDAPGGWMMSLQRFADLAEKAE